MTVYLVGAGPGDPGLLTVRGAEVLATADVVVYDRLSVATLLDLAPASAERIGVGKTPRGPSTPQDEINALLVDRGRRGQRVVRLKGGDPFVFARGGEEALALAAAHVPFEIVPGISSAIAAPAYAGVPVTHRGLSTSFTVVTGHEDPWAATETDWDGVARVGGTIVVLMGAATRGEIADRLMAAGRSPDTPVVAVQWGTRPNQRATRTTLDGLAAADVRSPSVIVIGPVAGLPEAELAWFESRPLFGRRVVVPRSVSQASDLASRLRRVGAEPVEVAVVRIEHVAGAEVRPDGHDWVVVASPNAVDALFAPLRDGRDLAPARVAAVGPGTADALARRGVVADLVPERSNADGLVAAFPGGPGRVLVPQSAIARPALVDGLRAKGWTVDAVVAYTTRPTELDDRQRAAVRAADAIAFTSSSTVDATVAAVGVDGVPGVAVAIGPSTAATAHGHGITVAATATEHTLDGLVAAVIDVLGNRERP